MKLYGDETGAETIRRLPLIVVSQIVRVEVPAALWKKQRMDELSVEDAAVLVTEFEADFFGTSEESARFAVTALTPPVLDEAARLTARHALRAYDAMQLASACAARDAGTNTLDFAAFDKTLCAAAAAEGLGLVAI